MGWFEFFFAYVISWWMLLFMVLPFKIKLPKTADASHYHSAPEKTYLRQKLIITTLLAFPVTLALYFLISSEWINAWTRLRF